MNILQLLFHLNQLQVEIRVEEDRLKISYSESRLTPDLVDMIKKNKKGIIDFLQKNQETFSPIEPVEKKEYYPSSSNQKRLYILQEIADDSTVYNLPNSIVLYRFEIEKFSQSLKELIQRHEILRTSFRLINDRLVQIVHPHVDVKVEYFSKDEGNWQEKSEKENIDKILRDFIRPFDLSKAPLLRAALIKLEERCIVMFDLHHIISDGVSMDIMIEEFMLLYSGNNEPVELRIHYKDYSQWCGRIKQVESMKKQEKFWLHGFSGEIPVLNLSYDYPRPIMQSFEGSTMAFQIETREKRLLKRMARTRDVTMYMLLLAFFNVLLAKLSRQQDIIIGTPIAGRRHADMEKIMGLFLNTLAMRNFPVGGKLFSDFLKEVKTNVLNAFENQDYQYEELLKRINVVRDTGRNPLFDAMFVLQNVGIPEVKFSKLDVELLRYEKVVSKFDLTLTAVEYPGAIWMDMEYCTKLFKSSTIHRFIEYFKRIISTVLSGGDMSISDIEIITDEEKRHMIYRFNDTHAEYMKERTIHDLFCEQSAKTPDFTAVTFTDGHLTYRELNDRAGFLGRALQDRGAGGAISGIMLSRSLELIIGIFGILKAGGAYLPIDPGYPEGRKKYILNDSRVKMLLADRHSYPEGNRPDSLSVDSLYIEETLNGQDIFGTGKKPGKDGASESPVYVIYTSGSTGNPKGTVIEHRSVVNRLNWMQKCYPIDSGDVIVQKTPIVFDVSVWELFWWSMTGARLFLLNPGGEKDPEAVTTAVERNNVTTMHFVPSMLNVFLGYVGSIKDVKRLKSLRQVFASGEVLSAQHVNKFNRLLRENNRTLLVNLYGPTEATVDVSYYNCYEREDVEEVPIGKPIYNTGMLILDKDFQIVPVGCRGELGISGDGLARGYLNNPELTADKFVENPRLDISHNGDPFSGVFTRRVMYRTGDLGKWLPDGNIEFLGRVDHQVKIRGFRIEIGEIEERLRKHDRVKDAVVVVDENKIGNRNLCAYIVNEPGLEVKELRSYLSGILPDYMVPAHFVQLDGIPLNSNGKVNRRLLPKWEFSSAAEFTGPGNEIEKKLVEIWGEVLEIEKDKIGIHDNFFDIGGHSFKVIQVVELANRGNLPIAFADIFKFPTIARLGNCIAGKIPVSGDVVLPVETMSRDLECFNKAFLPDNYPEYYPCIMAVAREKLRYEHKYDVDKSIFLTCNGSVIMGLGYECGSNIEEKMKHMTFQFGQLFGFSPAQTLLGYSIKNRVFPSFEEQIEYCETCLRQNQIVILTGTSYFLNYTPDYLLEKTRWLEKMDEFFPASYDPAADKEYGRMWGHVFILVDVVENGFIVYDSNFNFFGKVPYDDLKRATQGNNAIECSQDHVSYKAYQSYGILEVVVGELNRIDNFNTELQILKKITDIFLSSEKMKLEENGIKYIAFPGLFAILELIRIIKKENRRNGNSGTLFRYVSYFINDWMHKLLYIRILVQDLSKYFPIPGYFFSILEKTTDEWGSLHDDFLFGKGEKKEPGLLYKQCCEQLPESYKVLAVFFSRLQSMMADMDNSRGKVKKLKQ